MIIYHTYQENQYIFSCACRVHSFVFRELKKASSFSISFVVDVQSSPLALKAFINTKKLKTNCIESYQNFNILGYQDPRSYGSAKFIV